eukprot:360363-Chlamydomonas_euryale.AAC.7
MFGASQPHPISYQMHALPHGLPGASLCELMRALPGSCKLALSLHPASLQSSAACNALQPAMLCSLMPMCSNPQTKSHPLKPPLQATTTATRYSHPLQPPATATSYICAVCPKASAPESVGHSKPWHP